ncbi:MAG TPA: FAD-dependent oxidoreductase [Jatrophihabitantaceae bacterium]|jgi:sulfide:quinone oxidoreductase
MGSFSVVICGAGVAGVEGLLRLRRLAGDRVDVTLVSPAEEFVYRPLTVLEPFTGQPARRYPIARIAADTGAHWVRDSLAWLDRDHRIVHTTGGRQLDYDALLLAIGGAEREPSPHVDVFSGRGELYRRVLDEVETGRTTQLAFVLPPGPSWPLPLYELALLTAARACATGRSLRLDFVIPGPRPLAAFGGDAGEIMARLLSDAGITLHPGSRPRIVAPRRLVLGPDEIVLVPDRIISLPTIAGPSVRGIPGFALDRFLHVDEYCRVLDTGGRIYAAGDATDLPVKHGGVGAQQADVAAAGIAHLAGVGPAPERLRPRIDASLITGGKPLYLSAYLIDGTGWQARIHSEPPWAAGQKVVAEELGRFLQGVDTAAP